MKKQVPNNEIDLLLRRLSRDERPDAESAQSDHLDADELNAYAENALPEIARAKYTEHLADCSRCRRLVTQLTPSTIPSTSPVEKETTALSRFFSQLMSPMFLRYAVPGLAAVVIMTVGLMLIRRPAGNLVALREQPRIAATEQAAPKPETAAGPTSGFNDRIVDQDEVKSRGNTIAENKRDVVAKNQSSDDLNREAELQKQKEATGRVDRAEPVAETPLAAPAGASPVSSNSPVAKSTEVADKKKGDAAEAAPPKEEGRKLDNYQVAADTAKAESESRARRGPSKPAAMVGGELSREKQEKDSRDVRTVAGRRFHRENGIWIDAAYDSGATTNLARGSEQYRSLIADEPGIRTIAETLDGDIIVVWKGRAYRIR